MYFPGRFREEGNIHIFIPFLHPNALPLELWPDENYENAKPELYGAMKW